MCSSTIKGYIPPSVRKALNLAQSRELVVDIFRQTNHRTQSYRHLLPNPDAGSTDSSSDDETEYDANFLDDPELRTGKHRTVIALTSFLGSVNHFTKAEFLKRELNGKFRKTHPDVHPSLTLSQIRNLKTRLLGISQAEGLELATVARAFTYLEKLILARAVHKTNRRVAGGCCLILATKATDSKAADYARLLDRLATDLSVDRRELIELEFGVLAALHFQLQTPEREYGPHLVRILHQLDYSNLQEYLGERMHDIWQDSCAA